MLVQILKACLVEGGQIPASNRGNGIRYILRPLGATPGGKWPPAVDAVDVARGYEAALGAALGDDLQASIDAAAPAHWSLLEAGGDPELPAGVEPLAGRGEAPPALRRRLAQIGVVARAEGARLSALLKPGQRLVSLEGDLWRWDGFVSTAEAPTAAAQRLVEKNRLGDLSREAEAARQVAEIARAEATRTQAALREAATAESEARQRARAARVASDTARDKFAAAARRRAQPLSRLSALDAAEKTIVREFRQLGHRLLAVAASKAKALDIRTKHPETSLERAADHPVSVA